ETTLDSLAPFSYQTVSWSGTFPAGIPAGTYYLGWIIDSDNVVAEFDESNNTGFKSSPLLTISNPAVPDIRITPTTLNFSGAAAASEETNQPPALRPTGAAAAAPVPVTKEKLIDGAQIMQDFVQHPKVRVIANLQSPLAVQAALNFRSKPEMAAWRTTV